MVGHEEPFAPVLTAPVERQRLTVDSFGRKEGNQLLRELIGAEVVRAGRNRGRQAERLLIASYDEVSAGFGGVVRGTRTVRVLFGEAVEAVEIEVAEYLAGADVVYAFDRPQAAGFHQTLSAEDVGAKEGCGVEHRPAVVALGGEVHDGVDPVGIE